MLIMRMITSQAITPLKAFIRDLNCRGAYKSWSSYLASVSRSMS